MNFRNTDPGARKVARDILDGAILRQSEDGEIVAAEKCYDGRVGHFTVGVRLTSEAEALTDAEDIANGGVGTPPRPYSLNMAAHDVHAAIETAPIRRARDTSGQNSPDDLTWKNWRD